EKRERNVFYSILIFCDSCDHGFRSQDKYDRHISEYANVDCPFSVCEKIVPFFEKIMHASAQRR
ncbi:hypothetical protein DBR06_SOUSAS23010001, partial [Sousa chinensis]